MNRVAQAIGNHSCSSDSQNIYSNIKTWRVRSVPLLNAYQLNDFYVTSGRSYECTKQGLRILAAVQFPDAWADLTEWPENLSYDLRLPSEIIRETSGREDLKKWFTDKTFIEDFILNLKNLHRIPFTTELRNPYTFNPQWENMEKNIFLELQWLIDKSIIHSINSSASLIEYKVELVRFSEEEPVNDLTLSELDSHAHAATTLLILTALTLIFIVNMDTENVCRRRILLQEHGVWASTFYGEWMFSFYVLLIYPHTSYWFSNSTEQKMISPGSEHRYRMKNFEQDHNFNKIPCIIVDVLNISGDVTFEYLGDDRYTFKVYLNEITAIVGPPKSGKSKIMGVMSGWIRPDVGYSKIFEVDAVEDQDEALRLIGKWSSVDTCYRELTVYEHLIFFASCKLREYSRLGREVNGLLSLFGLLHKKYNLVSCLNEVEQQKLGICGAFMGDTKIVMLQNPTVGMSLSDRNFTWDCLLKLKNDRAIIIVENYLNDVDLYADRFMLMSNGRIECYGSWDYIKMEYGLGYHLLIYKNYDTEDRIIHNFLLEEFPELYVEIDKEKENLLKYYIPSRFVHKFQLFFSKLKTQSSQIGVVKYRLLAINIQDAFARIKTGASVSGGVLNPIHEFSSESSKGKKSVLTKQL
ncbi:DgyrCDS11767 [Dimorphilus gyrociliatus]|uniref:DgyrCDS11767 n=1 Tax=Dimorphilus gyrociliatus TaxID=2664684 RepID=A0A7I8W8A5_9ANNE|nr:DgyrCDS11767 [Dimorphilus gyrociliatus]